MWGNPVAEMMYESMRYFAEGRGSPTGAFSTTFGAGREAAPGRRAAGACLGKPVRGSPFLLEAVPDGRERHQPLVRQRRTAGLGVRIRAAKRRRRPRRLRTRPGHLGRRAAGIEERVHRRVPAPSTTVRRRRSRCRASATSADSLPKSRPSRAATTPGASPSTGARPRSVQRCRKTESADLRRGARLAAAADRDSGRWPHDLADAVRQVRREAIGPAPAADHRRSTTGDFQPTNQIVDFYVESLAADGRHVPRQLRGRRAGRGPRHGRDRELQYQVNGDGT